MNDTNQDPDLTLQYFGVAYIDILGQREKLLKIDSIPKNDSEYADLKLKIQSTYGTIIQIKESLIGLVDQFNNGLPSIKSQFSEIIKEMNGGALKVQQLGDAFIIYFPLGTKEENNKISILGIQKLLFSAAGIHLAGLAAKVPLRGSIAIGLGVEINPNELYGPVIVTAFDVEQKESEWMRIVVDKSVQDYLSHHDMAGNGIIPTSPKWRVISDTVNRCSSYISRDIDGRFVVNYLNPTLLEMIPEGPSVVSCALKFVKSEYNHFHSIGFKNPLAAKLSRRYKTVLDFFNDKMPKDSK